MKGLYSIAGISKQAHYKQLTSREAHAYLEAELVHMVHQVRKHHPRMGLRKLYHYLAPEGVGRDKFEAMMAEKGLKVKPTRSFKRTTRAHPASTFPNLIQGKKLRGPNQLWVSDITYIRVGEKFYYLTLILDVWSRRIVGWSLSKTLEAESNLRALKMAFRLQAGEDLRGMVHHSDRGSQYVYTPYLKALKSKGIEVSMGNKAWENAHAERINGTIKSEYIEPYQPRTWESLNSIVKKGIVLYNKDRPHAALNMSSPVQFENYQMGLAPFDRIKYLINY